MASGLHPDFALGMKTALNWYKRGTLLILLGSLKIILYILANEVKNHG